MPIADSVTQRVLDYIARLNDEGYQPTTAQVQAYARNPFRQGTLGLIGEQMRELGGVPNPVEWMLGCNWIQRSDQDTMAVTDLGRSAILALRRAGRQTPSGSVVVFAAGNPFNYADFVSTLAEYDPFMLVDPYFKVRTHLHDLFDRTKCNRILVSSRLKKEEETGLAIALREIDPEKLDIRVARTDIHDRFVIPDSGSVTSLGTSLTGIDKHFSVLVSIEDPWSSMIRDWHLEVWQQGKTLREEAT